VLTTRRQLFFTGARIAAAVPFVSGLGRALPAARDDERALVVLQLTGGNDGVNTVVPHRQDEYYRSRPTLGLARSALHRLDDDHGLHPELGALAELFDEGKVGVVHGIGYPNPDRSHFRSLEVWHTADPVNPPGETGWLGDLADQLATRRPGSMAALHVGTEDLPHALFARQYFAPTVRDSRGFRLRELGVEKRAFAAARGRLLDLTGDSAGDLAFLREAARSTYAAAARMEAMTSEPPPVAYPGSSLAERLQLVARLVTGGFGARVFHVSQNGYDTHAAQAPTHAALLRELARGLRAFVRDLEASDAAGRVVVLVHSEFGRRVRENGSKGTDHGAGAPAFVVGGDVRGGLFGTPPDLSKLVEGDVPYTTDFRALYTTLAQDWLELRPPTRVKGLALFG
jgi:uncharacterized protein (DUF1501 family)